MNSDRWATPPSVWRGVLYLFGRKEFDLDAFSEYDEHVSVPSHYRYTKEDDALSHPWFHSLNPKENITWVQPPFSRNGLKYRGHKGKMAAVVKAYEQAHLGCICCVYLPVTEPGRSSQGSWVATLDLLSVHRVYFVGRVEHVAPEGLTASSPGPAPHACWILAPSLFSAPNAWRHKTHWAVDEQRWLTPFDALTRLEDKD